MANDKEKINNELYELKTKVALLEDRLNKLDEIPTFEKTENMINRQLESFPNEEKIIVLIQETLKNENLVTTEEVEKKLSKLKLWLYGAAVGLVGMGLSIFL